MLIGAMALAIGPMLTADAEARASVRWLAARSRAVRFTEIRA